MVNVSSVLAHPGSHGQRVIKQLCVRVLCSSCILYAVVYVSLWFVKLQFRCKILLVY